MWLVKNFKKIVVKDQLTQNIFKKWAWKLISGLTGSCVLSSLISFLLKSTSFPAKKKQQQQQNAALKAAVYRMRVRSTLRWSSMWV